MILLIDNYDSFAYNLYQLVGSFRPDTKVVRNDKITTDEIEKMRPDAIFLSPGPGRPENAGICIPVIRRFSGEIPIFGVCLGHQSICAAFGGVVGYASRLMHGKVSEVTHSRESRLFAGIDERFPAARYHSLAAERETLPPELHVTAYTDDGEVMAVEHEKFPVVGVQFHPESVMTPCGGQIVSNFLNLFVR
ncbi:MAG: aminodeoxychorismate/anthranilate synthase component II [Firmicutes bacterium]|nr:aminodeoxychorismate/anthranilate synthase component II [Bacillota bacterium]MCD7788785.1 aminodeoxychorismate/anthranilate synthase component II [Bacillota bacterium]